MQREKKKTGLLCMLGLEEGLDHPNSGFQVSMNQEMSPTRNCYWSEGAGGKRVYSLSSVDKNVAGKVTLVDDSSSRTKEEVSLPKLAETLTPKESLT